MTNDLNVKYIDPKVPFGRVGAVVPGSPPPAVTSIRYWYDDSIAPARDIIDDDPIKIEFQFNKNELEYQSNPTHLKIILEEINTKNRINYTINLNSEEPFKLWQRSEDVNYVKRRFFKNPDIDNEIYDAEYPYDPIINTRMIIQSVNPYGYSRRSVFILPLKDVRIIPLNLLNMYQITPLLQTYWSRFILPEPENPTILPNTLYVYMDVDKETLEYDREQSLKDEWFYTNPWGNWKETNLKTFRWLINDNLEYKKLTADGWYTPTSDEILFIKQLYQNVLPAYRDFLDEKGLSFEDEHIFKLMIPHPLDNYNSFFIYFIKGTSCRI